jgi:hypothetical protein
MLPYLVSISGVFVIRRLQDDMQFSAGGEVLKKHYIWQSLTDQKTWIASTTVCFLWMMLMLIPLSLQVGIYMGLCVLYLSDDFLFPETCHLLLRDGPLYAFSLFTPTIIRQASFNVFAIYCSISHCHRSLVNCTVISIMLW